MRRQKSRHLAAPPRLAAFDGILMFFTRIFYRRDPPGML
jgi:hypothetical protein